MKQILKELWAENMPMICIGKVVIWVLLLFLGVLLRGYPYSITIVWIAWMFEFCTQLRGKGEIEYLLPRTTAQRKRMEITKAVIVAGTHALVTGMGYVLTIVKWYAWDKEYVFLVMFIVVNIFFFFFSTRILLLNKGKSKWNWVYVGCSFGIFLSLFYFIIRKMGNLGVAFSEGDYSIGEYGSAIVCLLLVLAITGQNVKKLEFTEYGE